MNLRTPPGFAACLPNGLLQNSKLSLSKIKGKLQKTKGERECSLLHFVERLAAGSGPSNPKVHFYNYLQGKSVLHAGPFSKSSCSGDSKICSKEEVEKSVRGIPDGAATLWTVQSKTFGVRHWLNPFAPGSPARCLEADRAMPERPSWTF
jgi:hypothetical protein